MGMWMTNGEAPHSLLHFKLSFWDSNKQCLLICQSENLVRSFALGSAQILRKRRPQKWARHLLEWVDNGNYCSTQKQNMVGSYKEKMLREHQKAAGRRLHFSQDKESMWEESMRETWVLGRIAQTNRLTTFNTFKLVNFCLVEIPVPMHVSQRVCEGQRTIWVWVVNSFLPSCGSWGLNSGHQVCQRKWPLTTESVQQPFWRCVCVCVYILSIY